MNPEIEVMGQMIWEAKQIEFGLRTDLYKARAELAEVKAELTETRRSLAAISEGHVNHVPPNGHAPEMIVTNEP